jgi:hypothetical protein
MGYGRHGGAEHEEAQGAATWLQESPGSAPKGKVLEKRREGHAAESRLPLWRLEKEGEAKRGTLTIAPTRTGAMRRIALA